MKAEIGRRIVDRLAAGTLRDEAGNHVAMVNDSLIRGFSVRRLPSDRVQYVLRYMMAGQRRHMALGLDGEITPEQAREMAGGHRAAVRNKRDPVAEERAREAASESFEDMRAEYVEHVKAKGLRTWTETERILKVYPRDWEKRPVYGITRADVATLLKRVRKDNGPVMAARVLAAVRSFFGWVEPQAADPAYVSPVTRGLAKKLLAPPVKRDRVLTPSEIRKIWGALDSTEPAIFGALVKMLFYTCTRRGEVASMEWSEIAGTQWRIPASKYKTNRPVTVPLSEPAQTILRGLKRKGQYVFSTDGGATCIAGWTKAKRELDRAAKVSSWRLHDIRRTARSLLTEAGVPGDVGEACLGHVIGGGGIRAVYDRYDFAKEKADALAKLADALAAILAGKDEPRPEVKKLPRKRKAVARVTASERRVIQDRRGAGRNV